MQDLKIFGWLLIAMGAIAFIVLSLRAAGPRRRIGSTDRAMFSREEIAEMERQEQRRHESR